MKRSLRLPWFRWKKRRREERQAPATQEAAAPAAAPEAAPTPPPASEVTELPSAEGEEKPKKRRRRGSRGGRGRRKPSQTTEAEAKPAPSAARKAEKPDRPERKQERSGRAPRRRTPPKRAPLPPAKRELLISADVGEQRVAVIEDDQVAEVYLERPERRSIAGNIYKGRVDNVLPGMEAAFVDIGLERNGFLFVDEIVGPELEGRGHRKIQDLLTKGQEILVQAVKDPMKSKGARLTTEISLPGRFVVYVPSGEGLGVSRRLDDDERTRLRDILKALDLPKGGVIVRTAAEGASAEDVERDLVFLQRLWVAIQKQEKKMEVPALVYEESELPLRVIRDLFTDGFERALVEDESTYRRIAGYLKKTSPHMVERVVHDREKQPLFERYGVDREIRSTLSRRVDLPSGGHLIFDYAEAFTVIDVNTGRFTGSRSKSSGSRLEDTITKNNLEAVKEVVRQLRLRDIGGIIVIDFIDMANPKNRALVEDALRTELERDRTKTYVVEISPLGLVEMTRQNVADGPREILTSRCTTCGGDGVVVSEESTAIEVERRLRALARQSRNQAFRVEVNARVAARLIGPGAERLRAIEEQARRRFWLVSRKDVPVDHFAVVAQGSRSKLAPAIGLEDGQEASVELGEVGLYDAEAGVGRLNGHAIVVGDAASLVGKKVKVRIERVMDGVAYATLVSHGGSTDKEPITPESEAVKPTRTRRRSRAAEPQEPAAPTAEEAERDEVEHEQPGDQEQPKRKTRRGSRGGRRRRRASTSPVGVKGAEERDRAATEAVTSEPAGTDGATSDTAAVDEAPPRIHMPDPELGRAEATAGQDGAEPDMDESPRPRKRTRRGSRGGRGRRKKAAAVPEQPADS
jgi:ribonuclease G